jgi:hypothetical protein
MTTNKPDWQTMDWASINKAHDQKTAPLERKKTERFGKTE